MVRAIARPAHAHLDAAVLQQGQVGVASVRAPLIRVMQHIRVRVMAGERHVEGAFDQAFVWCGRH
jgi:hypothetical protein